jgi:hypothetical protein
MIIVGYFHGFSTTKTQKSPKSFELPPFCRAFQADHFAKKKFPISSINDGARVKILNDLKLL